MKIKTTIVEITQEELVNLFATGLYGSSYLDADYNDNDDLANYDCFEDKLAAITITDYYAEGCTYGNLPFTIDEEDESATYTITLNDIKEGLGRAANLCPWAFNSFVDEESTQWDYYAGDALLQIIVFGELIYG